MNVLAGSVPPGYCLLFVPAGSPNRWRKAFATNADLVCIDLEDGTAADARPIARQNLLEFIAQLSAEDLSRTVVRINAVESDDWQSDIEMLVEITGVLNNRPAFVILPKVESVEAVEDTHRSTGLPIVALIETPLALENIGQLASAKGLVGLFLGSADLASYVPFAQTQDGLHYPRARLLYAGAAHNLFTIDTPTTRFDDIPALEAEVAEIRALGIRCKAAIHPKQVDTIRNGLRPTAEEIATATAILSKVDELQTEDDASGAFSVGDTMVDAPIIARMRQLLQQVERDHRHSQ